MPPLYPLSTYLSLFCKSFEPAPAKNIQIPGNIIWFDLIPLWSIWQIMEPVSADWVDLWMMEWNFGYIIICHVFSPTTTPKQLHNHVHIVICKIVCFHSTASKSHNLVWESVSCPRWLTLEQSRRQAITNRCSGAGINMRIAPFVKLPPLPTSVSLMAW